MLADQVNLGKAYLDCIYSFEYSSNGQNIYAVIMFPNTAATSLNRQSQFNKETRKSRKFMLENLLPAHLIKRIEDLQGREVSYIEDELFSVEALTNLAYREELERIFALDPIASTN
jgi:hypothetical protein